MSASEHTGAFATSDGSDSGGSSDGSGNSSQGDSSNSGNSSDGSGNSSDGSENSSNNSADSSRDSNSNESSNNSSEQSFENSSDKTTASSEDSKSSNDKNPVVSASVIGLTAVGLGAIFWQAAQRAMREPPPEAPPAPEEVARAAQTYLRGRTHQLREDLALGAGPSVEDLAALARIRREHVGIFGQLLRAHRKELLALADARRLTPERALAWLRRVGEIARTDPRLEEDRRAFLTGYAGGEASP